MTRALLALLLLGACRFGADYTPLSFTAEGDRLVAIGAIDDTTLNAFEAALAAHPDARVLELRAIEGSVDDEANVVFSRAVHASGLTTLVPADGMVASGGTDLFLAGQTRVLEPGACVGIHSWGADGGDGDTLPRDDPEHALYLDYYEDIGIDPAFYWHTLKAAPADGMHWMTADEAARFDMATGKMPPLGPAAVCELR